MNNSKCFDPSYLRKEKEVLADLYMKIKRFVESSQYSMELTTENSPEIKYFSEKFTESHKLSLDERLCPISKTNEDRLIEIATPRFLEKIIEDDEDLSNKIKESNEALYKKLYDKDLEVIKDYFKFDKFRRFVIMTTMLDEDRFWDSSSLTFAKKIIK